MLMAIYKPVEVRTEGSSLKEWSDCEKANWKHLHEIENAAIEAGGLLHRFMYEPVADGKAIYQIIRVNKKTVRVRACSIDGLYYDYIVPQWGEEATIPKKYAEKAIGFQDFWRGAKKD